MDLIGKAVCLGGSGELDTSGEYVKFDFYTVWSQVLARMINTPVGRPDGVPEQEPVQDQVDARERRAEVQAGAGAAGDRAGTAPRPTTPRAGRPRSVWPAGEDEEAHARQYAEPADLLANWSRSS